MLVELMDWFACLGYHSKANSISENISQICSLSTVPRKFIQNFIKRDFLHKHLPDYVISDEDTIEILSDDISPVQLFTPPYDYKMYLERPATNQCKRPGRCGFIFKVTPLPEDDVTKFNIQLVTDDREYTPDIHCHHDVVSAANMHLTVERYYPGDSRRFNRYHGEVDQSAVRSMV